MPTSAKFSDRDQAINKLAREVDLPMIAEELGMRVVGRGSQHPKALCPFHDDRRPSLIFYSGEGSRPQFHCFTCTAHGDVFDLIKKQLSCDFPAALQWLAQKRGVPLPSHVSKRGPLFDQRAKGLLLAERIYQSGSSQEATILETFAELRGFDPEYLHELGVFAAIPPKLSIEAQALGREARDTLEAAGLLVRARQLRESYGTQTLPLDLPPRDFYSTPRVLFTLRDDRGQIVGFTGRAISDSDTPKYLFSSGFPRSKTLYRLDHVRSRLLDRPPASGNVVELYVVEGILDALRLESLTFDATAIFGSHMTGEQIDAIAAFAEDLDRKGAQLAVHLFLDADDAGRRGTLPTLASLLHKSAQTTGFLVDVIVPPETETKRDPDELLRVVPDTPTAQETLYGWSYSPMQILLAGAADCQPSRLDQHLEQMPPNKRMRCYREVERRLDRTQWRTIFNRLTPWTPWRGPDAPTEPESPWHASLREFLIFTGRTPAQPAREPVKDLEKSEENKLNRALYIAQSSTQRRELPVDEGSWDRLKAAIDVTVLYLKELLDRAAELDEPMIAIKLPKSDGDFRLKALPCAEFLALQQYILNELIRDDYSETPRFRELIPAVRYTASTDGVRIETTGTPDSTRVTETVSFAYQLDMDVINGRIPPRREGMFRPYYQCWRDFVTFIDRRVRACGFERYHVARLDIRKFYDSLPRSAVVDALLPGVRNALRELGDRFQNGPLQCAGLFSPGTADAEQRAHKIVDWLCGQSFQYNFEDPGTGQTEVKSHGIPQGPDLSAYLATIALFPLDTELRRMVGELDQRAQEASGDNKARRGGVYARYVDDMVIVAPTAQDLARLRAAIEEQLGRIGLDLSPKTEPLPSMSESELREWLTNRRGAALGTSGPFEGPPINEPLSTLEPLADAGDIDRGKSLQILHDSQLDAPETPDHVLLEAVELARHAQDLRHPDFVKAATLIWRVALTETSCTPQEAVARLAELWHETDKSGNVSEHAKETEEQAISPTITDVLVWIDGLHKLILSRTDRSPNFSHTQQSTLNDFRRRVARLVQTGLCDELTKLLLPEEMKKFSHMLGLRCLAVFSAASNTEPIKDLQKVPWMDGPHSAAKARMLISIAQAHGNCDFLAMGQLQWPELAPRIFFHEAIARLIIAESKGAEPADPLDPIYKRFDPEKRRLAQDSSVLTQVLGLWLPGYEHPDPFTYACAAVAALAQLAPKKLSELLKHRSPLTHAILGGNAPWEGSTIPVPPGMDVPGLLGVNTKREVVRVEMREHGDGMCPPDLKWHDMPSPNEELKWNRFGAQLDRLQLLKPFERGSSVEPIMLRWLASAFRGLAGLHDEHAIASCPPTAGNIIGPDIGEPLDSVGWNILGFRIALAKLNGWAFIRHGRDGLIAEAVPNQDDHLWRIGTALADQLGRIESSSLLQQRLQAGVHVTGKEADWVVEAMLRFSLFRLRGRSNPTRRLFRAADSLLPATIERVLKRLEQFPIGGETSENVRTAHLLTTLAEGRALRARAESLIDSSLPGGAVALLVDLIRPQFCADEELAHRLPEVDSILPVWSPQRRPVLAWLSLSWRLEKLLADDPEGASDPTLPALITGTRLLAIETQLRTQALERWSLLDPGARHEILKSPPRFEPSSLLHRAQDTGEIEAFPGDNVRFLFQKLSDATTHNSTRFDALAGVTPLGWAVILGRLVDAIPTDVMPCESPEWFKSLSKLLQTTLDLDEDMPWGGFAPVLAAWDVQVLPRVFGDLARLDMDAGVRVNSEQGPHFKLLPHRRGVVDVSIPKGTVQLETWKFTWVGVPGEPHSGTESFRVANDDRLWFRWSETWLDERLLSVGVLQPQMASLAGVPSGEVVSTIVPPLTLPTELPPVEKNYVVAQTVSPASIEVVAPEPVAGVDAPLSVPPATPPVHLENPKPNAKPKSSPIDLFRKLEELQDANWSRRDRKALRHARIAFCQWQVDESYTHPVFEACLSQGDEALRALASSARKKPEVWNTYEFHESCAEHRRRRLLTAVLRACKKFAVDILLLPEYSIRADTALWLKENIAALSPTTSIWAGTYRVAAGSVLTVFGNPQPPAWSAVLPVILPPVSPGGTTTAQPRAKIYPAVAVDELFHPGSLFKAMFEPNSPNFDARSYIWELICSELFLVTSPSNLLAMAHARGVLMQQFGIPMKTEKELVDDLKSHIGIIAASTSLSQSMMPPRLIHLIPAMTRRTVDYFLSGQANFLAAGITTVFCNAVHQKYSKGQSCIIGHNGWGRDTTDQTGVPRPGPYHGLRPGVYIPFTRNDGPLGEFEQALVIADIDPVYSMEGSPRPQMLPPPLSLVAHLPIIESWELPNKNSKGNLCVCCGSPDRMPRVQEVVLKLLDSIDAAGSISKSHEDTNPDLLRTSLNLLADLDGRPDSWLHRRAEAYVREHSATPTGWPPPCALDWLWVNYGVHTEVKFPQIEMPAYSNAPKL